MCEGGSGKVNEPGFELKTPEHNVTTCRRAAHEDVGAININSFYTAMT